MKKSIFLILTVLFICVNSYAQEYVTVTAAPVKKEFGVNENIRVNVKATVQEGFHINANKIADEDLIPTTVSITEGDFKLTKVNWPAAKTFKFSFSETELQVFANSFTIGLNLKAKKDIKLGKYEVKGTVHYQACNDKACFAPRDAEFTAAFTLKEDTVKSTDTTTEGAVKKDTSKIETQVTKKDTTSQTTTLKENKRDTTQTISSTNQNQISGYIQEKGLFLTLILIFLGGLALNLTPCVYPLIPITISYFGAQVSNNQAQKILMALIYILGMSITYSALGLIAALTGGLFGSALQNPIVVSVIVLILLALALSMFGLFEIRIPTAIANFSGKSRQGYFGTVLMGLTVGFIAAPSAGICRTARKPIYGIPFILRPFIGTRFPVHIPCDIFGFYK
jgi:thiol:disulfide interchange protein DsbD